MRLPGTDSAKYPVVLVTFAPPGKRAVTNSSIPKFTLSPDRLNDRVAFGDEVFGVLPSIHYVRSVRVKKLSGAASQVTLSLFDPDFDNILTRLAAFYAEGFNFGRVYLRYGWMSGTETGLPMLSGNGEYVITEIDTNFTPDGCELEISGVDSGMYNVATQQVRGVAVMCDDLPGDEVVRRILETDYTGDSLYKPPKVVTEVPMAPLQLHGTTKHLIIQNTTPWAYCQQLASGLDADGNAASTPKLIPADPALVGRSAELVPEIDETGTTIVRVSVASPPATKKPVRSYVYGRGIDGNVVSFKISDNGVFSAMLGLRGPMQAVLPDGTSQSYEPPKSEDYGVTRYGPNSYARVVAAGDLKTLEARRNSVWAEATKIVVQGDMTVIGDTDLRILDLVQVTLFGGGTLANLGGYIDSADTRRGDAVRAIPGVSTVYTITEIEHTVEGGSFLTNLKIIKHVAPAEAKKFMEDPASNDALYIPHTIRRGRELL